MSSLFEEADIAADVLRKRPGFVAEDLHIMFRLLQSEHHPGYTGDPFDYLFDIWHDGYQARRAVEKTARMLKLLKERDMRAERREKLPFAERAAVAERIGAIAQEIAAMYARATGREEPPPPADAASWA